MGFWDWFWAGFATTSGALAGLGWTLVVAAVVSIVISAIWKRWPR